MLKFLVTGLVATLACAALACSGGSQGPTESEPGSSLASQLDVAAAGGHLFHTCSGNVTPCSQKEYESIVSSASYNPAGGTYKNALLADCTFIACDGAGQPTCASLEAPYGL